MTIALVLVVVFVLFLSFNGAYKTKRLFYGYTTRHSFADQFGELKVPLNTFGFKDLGKVSSSCSMEDIAYYKKPQLQCVAAQQMYTVIGSDKPALENFVSQAKELDKLLAQKGWKTQSNARPTFEQWFSDMVKGIDYNPGIGALKSTHTTHCEIQVAVAYSNPKPPAIQADLTCNSPRLTKLPEGFRQ